MGTWGTKERKKKKEDRGFARNSKSPGKSGPGPEERIEHAPLTGEGPLRGLQGPWASARGVRVRRYPSIKPSHDRGPQTEGKKKTYRCTWNVTPKLWNHRPPGQALRGSISAPTWRAGGLIAEVPAPLHFLHSLSFWISDRDFLKLSLDLCGIVQKKVLPDASQITGRGRLVCFFRSDPAQAPRRERAGPCPRQLRGGPRKELWAGDCV